MRPQPRRPGLRDPAGQQLGTSRVTILTRRNQQVAQRKWEGTQGLWAGKGGQNISH